MNQSIKVIALIVANYNLEQRLKIDKLCLSETFDWTAYDQNKKRLLQLAQKCRIVTFRMCFVEEKLRQKRFMFKLKVRLEIVVKDDGKQMKTSLGRLILPQKVHSIIWVVCMIFSLWMSKWQLDWLKKSLSSS